MNAFDFLIIQTITKNQIIYMITNHTTKEMYNFNMTNLVKFEPFQIDKINCTVIYDQIDGSQLRIYCFSLNHRENNEIMLNVDEIDTVKVLSIKKLITSDENLLMILNESNLLTVLRYNSKLKKIKKHKKMIHGAFDITAKRYQKNGKHFIAVATILSGDYLIKIYM